MADAQRTYPPLSDIELAKYGGPPDLEYLPMVNMANELIRARTELTLARAQCEELRRCLAEKAPWRAVAVDTGAAGSEPAPSGGDRTTRLVDRLTETLAAGHVKLASGLRELHLERTAAPRALAELIVGGAAGPESTIPNPAIDPLDAARKHIAELVEHNRQVHSSVATALGLENDGLRKGWKDLIDAISRLRINFDEAKHNADAALHECEERRRSLDIASSITHERRFDQMKRAVGQDGENATSWGDLEMSIGRMRDEWNRRICTERNLHAETRKLLGKSNADHNALFVELHRIRQALGLSEQPGLSSWSWVTAEALARIAIAKDSIRRGEEVDRLTKIVKRHEEEDAAQRRILATALNISPGHDGVGQSWQAITKCVRQLSSEARTFASRLSCLGIGI